MIAELLEGLLGFKEETVLDIPFFSLLLRNHLESVLSRLQLQETSYTFQVKLIEERADEIFKKVLIVPQLKVHSKACCF